MLFKLGAFIDKSMAQPGIGLGTGPNPYPQLKVPNINAFNEGQPQRAVNTKELHKGSRRTESQPAYESCSDSDFGYRVSKKQAITNLSLRHMVKEKGSRVLRTPPGYMRYEQEPNTDSEVQKPETMSAL